MKKTLLIHLARPFNKHALWLLVFLALSILSVHAQLIPPGRSIVWTNSAGIPGGVPNRTTIFCNVLVSIPGTNIVAAGNDVTDDSAAIQAALHLCPSNEVVYLPSATYLLSNTIVLPSGVTLRGNGTGNTILDSRGGAVQFGPNVSPMGPYADSHGYYSPAITSVAGTGTNSFTVSDATYCYGVGSFMMVSMTNDVIYNSNALVDIVGGDGLATWVDGGLGWNGTRAMGQIVQITNVTGNTIGFQPSLYTTYSNLAAPIATFFQVGCQWSGVENLTFSANNYNAGTSFRMPCTACCWIKNVEGNYADGDHVDVYFSYRCEVRDSYFHDAWLHTPGTYDSDVCVANKSSACLIENNILWRLHTAIMLEWGAAGNVIAYNFSTNCFDTSGYNAAMMNISNHGAHPMFNLYEGNQMAIFRPDSMWGSSSDSTAFRNNFFGMGYVLPPLTGNGPVQWTNGWIAYQCIRTICLDFEQRNYNLIGNVLGDDWMRTNSVTPGLYLALWPTNRPYSANSYIYSFGYSDTSDGGAYTNDNALPYATSIVEGNYDYVTQSTIWTNAGSYYATGTTPVALPASLYLTSQPAWWSNSVPFPAIGPDVAGLNNTIPAALRFYALQGGIIAKRAVGQTKGVGTETLSPPTSLAVGAPKVQASGGVGGGGRIYAAKDYYTNAISSGIQFESFWDGSDRWVGSGHFSASSSYTLTRVDIPLSPIGTPTNNIRAHIYADSSGSLGSSLGTVSAWTSPSQSGFVQFTNMAVTVVSGTAYWIVLETDETRGDGVNYQTWNYSFDAGNGPSWKSSDGATWSLISNNIRCNFITYSSP